MTDRILIHPFDPIQDQYSKVLILGSFPSVVSRAQSFYYANSTNRFWKVLSSLFHEEIKEDNENRKTFCSIHQIALWDVIHSCSIIGSSDASIKDVKVNDIQALIDQTKIQTVFTTGGRASSLYEKYVTCDKEHISLPSTSAANAKMRLEDLIKAYAVILEKLNEED